MSDIQRYIPMKRICAMAVDACDKSGADFDRMWIFCFRALVDLMGISDEPKSARLPVTDQKTVFLPGDYVSWRKVGIMCADGTVATLRQNNALSTFRDTNPGRLGSIAPAVGNNAIPYYLNYRFDGSYLHVFGTNSGLVQAGDCKVDEKNKLIVLSPSFPYADVMLEYICSPEQDSDYMVDIYLQESIIAFCEWKMKMGTEQSYYNRIREARRRIDPIRLQIINQAIRQNHGWKLKA
jgi:hypothetical protein